METAREFAINHATPVELTDEMAEFAMFSLDMGEIVENGQPMFPKFIGKEVNLWDVVPQRGATAQEMDTLDRDCEEARKQSKLETYIARGWAFEPPTIGMENE